jgi:hypothetical protein
MTNHQALQDFPDTNQAKKSKAVLLHAMVALAGRRGIDPTHS